MFFSLLGTSFLEFMQNEWLGLVASLIVLVSFLMTNQIKTRIINMVGCIAFVIYGLLLPTYSTAFMNGAVFIVHVVFLVKHFVDRRKGKTKKTEEAQLNNGAEANTEEKPSIKEAVSAEEKPSIKEEVSTEAETSLGEGASVEEEVSREQEQNGVE